MGGGGLGGDSGGGTGGDDGGGGPGGGGLLMSALYSNGGLNPMANLMSHTGGKIDHGLHTHLLIRKKMFCFLKKLVSLLSSTSM